MFLFHVFILAQIYGCIFTSVVSKKRFGSPKPRNSTFHFVKKRKTIVQSFVRRVTDHFSLSLM